MRSLENHALIARQKISTPSRYRGGRERCNNHNQVQNLAAPNHLQRTTSCANDIVKWILIMFCMIAGGASVGWSGHAATSQLEWYRYGIVFSIKKDLWRTR